MGDLERGTSGDNFWKEEFPKIIAEFENAENGRLVQKNKQGTRKGRHHFDMLNLSDNVVDDIEVPIS